MEEGAQCISILKLGGTGEDNLARTRELEFFNRIDCILPICILFIKDFKLLLLWLYDIQSMFTIGFC